MFPPLNEQLDIIKRGVAEIIREEDLARKIEHSIAAKRPLNVKLGCDPSRPDLHLGHSVVLRKLRQFQDLGHQAILIVGDFTGMIGDPSGRSKTRPPLTLEETRNNGQSYFEQATKILSAKKIQMLYNSEWLGKMTFADVILLASKYTVARILERDDFERRYKAGEPISVHELMYPLAQAMDSVAVQADIELGGTDQKFNLLVGRDIQREQGMDPQIAITLPILPGTDGVEKMSKSLDNYIAINESPAEMYGKTLSIPDPLIYDYYLLATDVPASDLRGIRTQLDGGTVNPMDLKRRLARELVRMYHNREAARAAEEDFNRKFRDKTTPTDLEEFRPVQEQLKNYITLTVATGSVESGSAARRLIESGGLYVDGQRIDDPFQPPPQHGTFILKIGKKVFWRIVIQEQPDKS